MRSAPSRLSAAALVLGLLPVAAGGCGKTIGPGGPGGAVGLGPGTLPGAAVTKNTAQLGDGDPVTDAASVARTVYPGLTPQTRPGAVALVNDDWRSALAAAVLSSPPLRMPLLFTHGGDVPGVSSQAVRAMAPRGSATVNGAQLIRVGGAGAPGGYVSRSLAGPDAPTLAATVATYVAGALGTQPRQVLIVNADGPASFAVPAAGLAAESGAPILFVTAGGIPAATRSALEALGHPTMYVIGPNTVVEPAVIGQLAKLGALKRIRGADPVANAIAVAQYIDAGFGWGVVDPGHGLVFASATHPLDAAAAAPLSASGDYGPLLLLAGPDALPPALVNYLTSIQPGYTSDPRFQPVRGVYNRGWLIGGPATATPATQARLDALLEISLRANAPAAATSGP
jgi:hypothetical protein